MSQVAAQPSSLLSGRSVTLGQGVGNSLSLGLIGVGGIGLIVAALLGFTGSKDVAMIVLASYHVGVLFCVGMALGCMGIVMILHQVNAGWSALVRRQVENTMSMLFPVCALLFLPILISTFVAPGKLWHWMDADYVAGDLIYAHKQPFLNVGFFTIRTIAYFVIWGFLAWKLYGYSRIQDSTADKWLTAKARRMSSYGLLLFAVTTAFAGFDWIMSLDYHWFSTMFGVYFFAGNFGAALAVTILIMLALRRQEDFRSLVTQEHLHDLGKLLFGFCVFWAYIGFSQYFLIWYANIPEETSWFLARRTDTWYIYSILLAVCRFVIPFVVLMPRPFRRSPRVLAIAGVWILVCHALDLFWMVRPEFTSYETGADIGLSWQDVVAFVGPVALFAGLLVRKIISGPLVPTNDPRLAESLHHKNTI
ncbi:MAG: quinol:cytochrome C oxidoreductase [Phycisphaerales bacterium JB043]